MTKMSLSQLVLPTVQDCSVCLSTLTSVLHSVFETDSKLFTQAFRSVLCFFTHDRHLALVQSSRNWVVWMQLQVILSETTCTPRGTTDCCSCVALPKLIS